MGDTLVRFEVNEEHDVLESWESYIDFARNMRKISVQQPITWEDFLR